MVKKWKAVTETQVYSYHFKQTVTHQKEINILLSSFLKSVLGSVGQIVFLVSTWLVKMPSWVPQQIKRDKVPLSNGAPRNSKSHTPGIEVLCVILKPKLNVSDFIIQLG